MVTEPLPTLAASEPDDIVTTVMERPTHDLPRSQPPRRPARPDIDLVTRDNEDHTVVMANAPGRVPAPPSFPAPSFAATPPPPAAHTIAMHAGQWTPSAPPIAGGRIAHPPPTGTPPPPNVRVQPASLAPMPAHFAASHGASMMPSSRAQMIGLVAFAAPLALAVLVLARLALG